MACIVSPRRPMQNPHGEPDFPPLCLRQTGEPTAPVGATRENKVEFPLPPRPVERQHAPLIDTLGVKHIIVLILIPSRIRAPRDGHFPPLVQLRIPDPGIPPRRLSPCSHECDKLRCARGDVGDQCPLPRIRVRSVIPQDASDFRPWFTVRTARGTSSQTTPVTALGTPEGAHYWDEYCQWPQLRSTQEAESRASPAQAEDLGRVGQWRRQGPIIPKPEALVCTNIDLVRFCRKSAVIAVIRSTRSSPAPVWPRESSALGSACLAHPGPRLDYPARGDRSYLLVPAA